MTHLLSRALVVTCLVATASATVRAESVAPQAPLSCDAPLAPVSPTGQACALFVAILTSPPPAGDVVTATLDGTPVDVDIAPVSFLEMSVDERICREDCSTAIRTSQHLLDGFQIVPLAPLAPGQLEVVIDDEAPISFILEDTESCTSELGFHVPVTCGHATCDPGLTCMRPDAGPTHDAAGPTGDADGPGASGCRAGTDTAPTGAAIAALSVLALLAWRRRRPGDQRRVARSSSSAGRPA